MRLVATQLAPISENKLLSYYYLSVKLKLYDTYVKIFIEIIQKIKENSCINNNVISLNIYGVIYPPVQ
ncbi:hypothetical protein CAL7716_082810 [Calothrix sp. PCC 7716]|nr:hypothetical protein CAL7716_082810 [Calothrix sp. PCC 7716]